MTLDELLPSIREINQVPIDVVQELESWTKRIPNTEADEFMTIAANEISLYLDGDQNRAQSALRLYHCLRFVSRFTLSRAANDN
jgi:hypothetical protein